MCTWRFAQEIRNSETEGEVQRLASAPARRAREEPVVAGELPILVAGGLQRDVDSTFAFHEADDDRVIALQ